MTWSSGAAVPTEDQLRAVLNAYGPVRQVALKKRSASVMFRDEAGAKNADENYRGPWRLNELGAPGETPKTPPPTVHKPSPRAHHSPPRHMKPVVREAPLQHQAPVVGLAEQIYGEIIATLRVGVVAPRAVDTVVIVRVGFLRELVT